MTVEQTSGDVVSWTTTPWGSASSSDKSAGSVDARVLFEALEALWEQTRHQAETTKAVAVETYAERLARFHPPAVFRVLEDWPKHNEWWPSLKEMLDRLPPEGWTPAEKTLSPPARDNASRAARLLEGAANLERRASAFYSTNYGNMPPNIEREIAQMRERAQGLER